MRRKFSPFSFSATFLTKGKFLVLFLKKNIACIGLALLNLVSGRGRIAYQNYFLQITQCNFGGNLKGVPLLCARICGVFQWKARALSVGAGAGGGI